MATVVVSRSTKESTLSRSVLEKIVNYVCAEENREILGKLSIAFISLDEIRALKKEFFHQNIDTDVISFFYGTEEPDEVWGEIIICPEKAREYAHTYGTKYENEQKLLLIHGLLHLLGYDDSDADKKRIMETRQNNLLEQFLITEKRERLVTSAQKAQHFAYAPYSLFPVGAALETCDGKVIQGGNIENASLGLSVCAERVALFKAVSMGYATFTRLAVVSSGQDYCLPCGACRQVLYEFAPYLEIVAARHDGDYQIYTLDELLPHPFQFKPEKGE
ncbi:cytidine deaminase [Atribacter laminatus]|uniref:Endoribonuclease YbeY n=1 Tax=Atribacter laminatus TaxID=2847778 RepID=A0A7T1F3G3_ATRLM|nr:cytidine deaminase [Atribacter laminatus]QPM68380.1 Cytidine deaminase [Atribacter laminatus]